MYYFAQSSTMNVYVYDINNFSFKIPKHVDRCRTIKSCVQNADLVVICVPIKNVVSVVSNCLLLMKRGTILCEISSIKNNVFTILRNARKDVTCLSIHPMFGPATKRSANIKTLLIPVRNQKRELALLSSIFPRSEIEVVGDPDLHDRYMAVVIGLTYYINLVLGSVLSKLDLKTMKKVAGTTFGMQAMITESVLNDSPELVTSLLKENPFNIEYISYFLTEADTISRLLSSTQDDSAREFVEVIKTRLRESTDTKRSYYNFYKTIEYIKMLNSGK